MSKQHTEHSESDCKPLPRLTSLRKRCAARKLGGSTERGKRKKRNKSKKDAKPANHIQPLSNLCPRPECKIERFKMQNPSLKRKRTHTFSLRFLRFEHSVEFKSSYVKIKLCLN